VVGALGNDEDTLPSGIKAIELPAEPGKRARAIRTALGLTRVEVARSAGLTSRQIAATERNRRELTQAQWRSLAGSLGVEVAVLLPAELLPDDDPEAEARRIDAFVGHDPDHEWNTLLPRTAAGLPPALAVDLPDPERRRDEHTRARIERSWSEIRGDLDEVIACCAGLVHAGSGADADELLDALDAAVHKVRDRRSFRRRVANHRRALDARVHAVDEENSPVATREVKDA
jgi:transcriptional regulator with XRE-family HTH domain